MSDPKQDDPSKKFLALVRKMAEEFAAAAPLSISVDEAKRAIDRVVASLRKEAARSPAIYECTSSTVGQCVAMCALTGLLPGGPLPDVYLVPRRNNKAGGIMELHWQISFRGYLTLARRSGYQIKAVPVFDGERFAWTEGLNPSLEHEPSLDRTETWDALRAVYVVAHTQGMPAAFQVATKTTIDARRKAAQKDDFWAKWPVEMAMKAAVRYAAQRGLIALDEVAAYAHEMDGEQARTVIDAEPVEAKPKLIAEKSAWLDPLSQLERATELVHGSEE